MFYNIQSINERRWWNLSSILVVSNLNDIVITGGSLLDVIKHKIRVSNCVNGVFDEATIATVLKEVLKGLEYFHSNGQIHRYCKLKYACFIFLLFYIFISYFFAFYVYYIECYTSKFCYCEHIIMWTHFTKYPCVWNIHSDVCIVANCLK